MASNFLRPHEVAFTPRTHRYNAGHVNATSPSMLCSSVVEVVGFFALYKLH